MPEHHLIGPFVRRFLIEELIVDRNLSLNTQRSYRDAIRLLFVFLAERHSTDPTRVTVEQVDAAVVRGFLRYLEDDRGNSTATRNQRLATPPLAVPFHRAPRPGAGRPRYTDPGDPPAAYGYACHALP